MFDVFLISVIVIFPSVVIETGEGTSTEVRAEEKARQRPASSFPGGL
jgi:hypothetical protein